MNVYLVFIHERENDFDGYVKYGGYFSTKEKAEEVCKTYNEKNVNTFADYINVTEEKNEVFI